MNPPFSSTHKTMPTLHQRVFPWVEKGAAAASILKPEIAVIFNGYLPSVAHWKMYPSQILILMWTSL